MEKELWLKDSILNNNYIKMFTCNQWDQLSKDQVITNLQESIQEFNLLAETEAVAEAAADQATKAQADLKPGEETDNWRDNKSKDQECPCKPNILSANKCNMAIK